MEIKKINEKLQLMLEGHWDELEFVADVDNVVYFNTSPFKEILENKINEQDFKTMSVIINDRRINFNCKLYEDAFYSDILCICPKTRTNKTLKVYLRFVAHLSDQRLFPKAFLESLCALDEDCGFGEEFDLGTLVVSLNDSIESLEEKCADMFVDFLKDTEQRFLELCDEQDKKQGSKNKRKNNSDAHSKDKEFLKSLIKQYGDNAKLIDVLEKL